MSSYIIPKIRTKVEVYFNNDEFDEYEFFLAEQAINHEGSQRLSEVLNSKDFFVATIMTKNDKLSLLNTKNILYALADAEVDGLQRYKQDIVCRKEKLKFGLINGVVLEGYIFLDVSKPRQRAVDFVNSVTRFVTSLNDDGKACLINKNKISWIEISGPQQNDDSALDLDLTFI